MSGFDFSDISFDFSSSPVTGAESNNNEDSTVGLFGFDQHDNDVTGGFTTNNNNMNTDYFTTTSASNAEPSLPDADTPLHFAFNDSCSVTLDADRDVESTTCNITSERSSTSQHPTGPFPPPLLQRSTKSSTPSRAPSAPSHHAPNARRATSTTLINTTPTAPTTNTTTTSPYNNVSNLNVIPTSSPLTSTLSSSVPSVAVPPPADFTEIDAVIESLHQCVAEADEVLTSRSSPHSEDTTLGGSTHGDDSHEGPTPYKSDATLECEAMMARMDQAMEELHEVAALIALKVNAALQLLGSHADLEPIVGVMPVRAQVQAVVRRLETDDSFN